MARASKLFYMAGITRDAGDYFDGIPQRDLAAVDIAALSDADYAHITGTPPFAVGSPYQGPLYAESLPTEAADDGSNESPATRKRK